MAVQNRTEKNLSRSQTLPEGSFDRPPPVATKNSRRRQRNRLNSVTDIKIPLPQVESPTSISNPTPTPKGRSQNQKEPPGSTQFHEHGNWTEVAADCEGHDERLVKKWNEQIDTLLVFAGLFSAVVTAFNIESYRQLRLDSDEASRALLITISQQLGNLPQLLSSNFPSNATAQILSQLDAFEPATADVWINGLWFASLVCSLIAASLGILVKQWLQRFKTEDYSMARERTRLRQHRFEGLELWGVPRIVAFLPLILRTSLNLFFIGLIVFLRNLHIPIAIAISFLISLWFMAYIASLILPSFCSGCPYKSPEATLFYIVRRLHKDGWKSTVENWHFISWADGEEEIKRDVSYDVSTLATVDRIFGDISLDRLVRACLKDLRKEQVIDCVRRIITYRLHTKLGVMAQWKSLDTSRITKKCSEALINILLDTLERLESHITDPGILQSTVDYMEQALECVIYLIECVDWGIGAASFDDRLMAILSKLMEIAAPLAGLTASIEKHVITILSNRPVQSHAPTIAALPRLFSSAGVMFDLRPEDILFPVKVSATMLSLTTCIKTEALNMPSLLSFLDSCDAALSSFDLPQGTTEAMRRDVRQRLETCRFKVQELELRMPEMSGNLLSTVEVCIARVNTVLTIQ